MTGFVKKVHFDTKIMENNNKMSDTNNFHRKANCNTKLRKLKKKKYQMQLTLQKKLTLIQTLQKLNKKIPKIVKETGFNTKLSATVESLAGKSEQSKVNKIETSNKANE